MIAIALAIALIQSVVHGQTMVTVKMGDTANFTLNSPNNLVCTRNKQTINFSGRYGLVNNNDGTANMTLSQVTKDDYGLYTCMWNSDPNTMIQFSLVVVEPIYMDVNQVVYNLNDNVTVTCRVTFYMTSNLMLNPDQDLALSMILNGRELARDNRTSTMVAEVRKRNLTYSGGAIEDMRNNNVTCLLKSMYFSESASQRVYITTPPKEAKIANKSITTFYPGQTLVCTVDSYPYLTVNWNKLNVPCQSPPTPWSPNAGGMATLTLTQNCLGQQTWSCTATWTDMVTVVNDTITFTVLATNSSLDSQQTKEEEDKRKLAIGLGVGLGLGIPLLILLIALIIFCCRGSDRGGSIKKSDPTKKAQAAPKKATAPVTTNNPNPNPNFHALPSYNQVAKPGNGVSRGGPGVPDIGVAHLNGSGSIPQLNSSLDGQINFRTDSGAVNLGKADLGFQNRSFTNI